MSDLAADLRRALDDLAPTGGLDVVARDVERLSTTYRRGGAAASPILNDASAAVAYAAYRVPATFAAARAVLGRTRHLLPSWRPRAQLDLGGGVGAAVWAAAEVFDSIESATVVDYSGSALALGQQLALNAGELPDILWQNGSVLTGRVQSADLLTLSYLLGELSESDSAAVVDRALGVASVLVVIEPGTPAGYHRMLAVRDRVHGRGWRVVAPCPHELACPLAGSDWCHFSVRLPRSPLHRRTKGGERGYEDEKYSYLVAARDLDVGPTAGRILRHPLKRKGLVQLQVCQRDGIAAPRVVSRRQGLLYRAARQAEWGDGWPPAADRDQESATTP